MIFFISRGLNYKFNIKIPKPGQSQLTVGSFWNFSHKMQINGKYLHILRSWVRGWEIKFHYNSPYLSPSSLKYFSIRSSILFFTSTPHPPPPPPLLSSHPPSPHPTHPPPPPSSINWYLWSVFHYFNFIHYRGDEKKREREISTAFTFLLPSTNYRSQICNLFWQGRKKIGGSILLINK